MSYTHRERVLAAFRHEQPDRVPMDLMGNASMLLDEPYLLLRDHLGLSPIPPARSGQPASYYDERILEHFDIDFRRVFLPVHPEVDVVHHADGSFTDPWKIRYIREGPFVNSVGNPLAGITTLAELQEYRWPRPEEMFATGGLRDTARRLCEETDYAVVARNPLTQGFLDRACYLMGMGDFFVTIRLYPDLAQAIFDGILEVYQGVYAMFLEEVGPYVQMVETADDLGTSGSLMVSPKMYRQHIKPAEAALCSGDPRARAGRLDLPPLRRLGDAAPGGFHRDRHRHPQSGADLVARHGRRGAQAALRRPPDLPRRRGRLRGAARRRGGRGAAADRRLRSPAAATCSPPATTSSRRRRRTWWPCSRPARAYSAR